MARTRVDVWKATDAEGDWPAVLASYERAIGTMRGLDPASGPPTDPVSWQFQAAIHGRHGRERRRGHQQPVLVQLPARQLVLPAVAPDVPRGLRADHPVPPRGRPVVAAVLVRHRPRRRAQGGAAAGLPRPHARRQQPADRDALAEREGRSAVLRRHRSRRARRSAGAGAAGAALHDRERILDVRRWRACRPELRRRRARAARERPARPGALARGQRLRRRLASGLRGLDGLVLHGRPRPDLLVPPLQHRPALGRLAARGRQPHEPDRRPGVPRHHVHLPGPRRQHRHLVGR